MTSKELVEGCIRNNYRMSSISLKRVVTSATDTKKQNVGRIYAKVRFVNADVMEGMEEAPRTKIFWAESPIKGTDLEGKPVVENQAAIDNFVQVWKDRAELITIGDITNPALMIVGSVISVPVDAHYKLRNAVGPNAEPKGSRFKVRNEKGVLVDKVYNDITVFSLFDKSGSVGKDPLKEALNMLNNPANCTRVSQVNSANNANPAPVAPATTPEQKAIADLDSDLLGSAEDE